MYVCIIRYEKHEERYNFQFINLSNSNSIICVVISIGLTSMFLIIGLTKYGVHHCAKLDGNMNTSRMVSKQHIKQIVAAYTVCIIIVNGACVHIFMLYSNLSLETVPQDLSEYQCSTSYSLIKSISWSLICVYYFAIHELWNLRMISYYYNKHDCQKNKFKWLTCSENSGSHDLSKYQSTSYCHSQVSLFVVLFAFAFSGTLFGIGAAVSIDVMICIAVVAVTQCLFAIYEHCQYSHNKMDCRFFVCWCCCRICCKRSRVTVCEYLLVAGAAYAAGFVGFLGFYVSSTGMLGSTSDAGNLHEV